MTLPATDKFEITLTFDKKASPETLNVPVRFVAPDTFKPLPIFTVPWTLKSLKDEVPDKLKLLKDE